MIFFFGRNSVERDWGSGMAADFCNDGGSGRGPEDSHVEMGHRVPLCHEVALATL